MEESKNAFETSIKGLIAEKIHWYDAISDAIFEKLIFNGKKV